MNDNPTATADSFTVAEDSGASVLNVLGNDSFAPDSGETLTVTSVTQPANGTVSLVGGVVSFTPNSNFFGSTSFDYTISDGNGGTATASASVTVTPVNDNPVVGTGNARVSEEGLIGANVDTTGSTDTTNALTSSGTIAISDVDNTSFAVTLSSPLTTLTSNGQTIIWTGSGTNTLIGSAGGKTIITATITNAGAYTVTLSGAIDHAIAGVEDVRSFGIGVNVFDGANTTSNILTVNIEDDSPVVIAAPNNAVIEGAAGSTLTGALNVNVGADSGSLAKVIVTGTVDSSGFATGTVVNEGGVIVTQNLLYNGMKIQYLAGATPGSIVGTATDGTQVFTVSGNMTNSTYTVTMLKALDLPTYTSSTFGGLTAGNTAGTFIFTDGNQNFTVLATATTLLGLPSTVNTSQYIGVGNNSIDGSLLGSEKLRLDFDAKMSVIGIVVNQLGSNETLFYTAYNAAGGVVGSGSVAGQGNADVSVNLTNFSGGGFTSIEFTAASNSSYRLSVGSLSGQSSKVNIDTAFNLAGVDADGDAAAGQAINVTFDSNSTLVAGSGSTGYAMGSDSGNDTITGGTGDDSIFGGAGNDTISAGDGKDVILGGAGNDVLTGGLGVDTFKWTLADAGPAGSPAVDRITDFNKSSVALGGDILDFRDLLTGESQAGGNLANYLHFEKVGTDTVVHISSSGQYNTGFSISKDVQTVTLTGVDLVTGFANDQAIIADLLANQKLITD